VNNSIPPDFEEYVRRFGDLPKDARTQIGFRFAGTDLYLRGWWRDIGWLTVEALDGNPDAEDYDVLVRHDHHTLVREDYAFDDVRDAIASTLAEGVRAHFRREAAP